VIADRLVRLPAGHHCSLPRTLCHAAWSPAMLPLAPWRRCRSWAIWAVSRRQGT